MKKYDYANIKKYIQMHSDLIESVSLGIEEDWWWTAECIYEDSSFKVDLDIEPEIAGIKGSRWATPVMEVTFKDGSQQLKESFTGDSSTAKPEYFSLGVLSQECQDIRAGKFID